MSSVSGLAASQSAITAAQVRSAVCLAVLKIARQSDRQMGELVAQAVETVTQTMRSAARDPSGRLDAYG